MTDIAETVDTYLAGWNETDPVRRVGIVESVWAADGRLVDPPLAATGQTEISDMAGSLQSQFPATISSEPAGRRAPRPLPLRLGSRRARRIRRSWRCGRR